MSSFWSKNPSVLFDKDYIYQLWPTSKLNYSEKMNAISRLVIILSILGYIFTQNLRFILIGLVMLLVIYFVYQFNGKKALTEGFMDVSGGINIKRREHLIDPKTLPTYLKEDFIGTTKKNPFGNVLMTDYTDDPKRKAAPPSFNTEVYENINKATKKMVQQLNPGIKNTNKQLYGDLGEKFEFDQSQWYYYSNPNTKIPNDQGSYAEYLYGNMPSSKEGNPFALVQDNIRYNLY
jgi:hypothetical protein